MSAEEKWKTILTSDLPNLLKLVSKIFCIPVSNASVELIFSLCSAQWTDTRTSLNVDTVKSLPQVKMNCDLDCCEMYNMLISTPKLLKQIMESEKYEVWTLFSINK